MAMQGQNLAFVLLSVNFACVIGDKMKRCHLFLLKQEIAMDLFLQTKGLI
jgi:hypothetical protein